LSDGYDIKNAVNKEYREIIDLFGVEVAVRLYRHFRGCRIDCPKFFYNVDFVIQVAATKEDRREREKVAVVCGYTAEWIESKVREYLKQQEG
jgi:hypothetical protein